jgi:hypothetical protein
MPQPARTPTSGELGGRDNHSSAFFSTPETEKLYSGTAKISASAAATLLAGWRLPGSRMAMFGLYVRQGAPWFADLRAELLSFPAGKHDDQVDALGLIGQLLDRIGAGQKPELWSRPNAMPIARRPRKCRTTAGRRCEA